MQFLDKNWITENHIDFEYKKYVLLAYLQHVSEHFTEQFVSGANEKPRPGTI